MIQIKKLNTPEVKLLAQGHITSRKQNQGLNPRLPTSTEFFLHDAHMGLFVGAERWRLETQRCLTML